MNIKLAISKGTALKTLSVSRFGQQILNGLINKLQRVIFADKFVWLYNFGERRKMNGEENELTSFKKHKAQGFQWCKEFIGGSWSNIQENDFVFTELSGGLTNLLYTCELSDNIETKPGEARTVLLRVYGDIAKDLKFLVKNSVIFCLLSEKHLGPKCFGLYPDGRIEEYIPTKCLQREDLHNPEISRQIAKKLAVIHNLDMPLCKEPKFLKELMEYWLAEITNNTSPDTTDPNKQKIAEYDLDGELSWLLAKLEDLNSPVVFSHNDLQEGNMLYFRECEDQEKRLTIIDLEYCSYNYRGFDFGNHFCEWCYDYQSVTEMPCFSYHEESYPNRQQQYEFFREYLNAKNEPCTDESLEKLYIEANTCALASHLMWGLWSIVQNEKSDIEFGYLEYAICRFEAYFKAKKAMFPEDC